MPAERVPSVLCVDDDRDIAEIVEAVLADEGYRISCLYSVEDDALFRAVGRLEPDCVLLDSTSASSYGEGWALAETLAKRSRTVPVVMFTAHGQDAREARGATSDRARAAHFAGILEKPFSIDELIETVARATGGSVPFDRSAAGEATRTRELVAALKQHGASDIQPSKRREWATFRDGDGHLYQVYWWEGRGVYQLGRYKADGRMTMMGQFVDRDAAIDLALPAQGT